MKKKKYIREGGGEGGGCGTKPGDVGYMYTSEIV